MNPDAWRLHTRLAAALLSGGLLFSAFPPVDLGWIGFGALGPLFLALRGAKGRTGFLIGFVFGLAFFGPLIWWISLFGFLAWATLVAAQALAMGLFGWFAAWASREAVGRLVAVPLMFIAMEIVRTGWPLGGFAWGGLGYTQYDDLPLLPLARVGGVHVIGLALAVIAALAAQVIASGRVWRRAIALVLAGGIVAGPFWLPLGLAGSSNGLLDVALVQGNVPEGSFTGFADRTGRTGPEDFTIIDNHISATEPLASDPPDLVVWPENSVDRDPFANPDIGLRLEQVVRNVGAPFIVGAILNGGGEGFRNAAILFSSSGTAAATYDKIHLVPFGEYVPWSKLRDWIPALEQIPTDGIPGNAPVVFNVGTAKVGTVICFESTYPRLVRDFVAAGAEVIVVATNNASFRRSPAARQHVQMSALRAVEEGRWVLHAAISGITAVVAPDGRIVERTSLFEQAVVRRNVELAGGRTIYGRFGESIELGLTGLGGVALVVVSARRIGLRRSRRYEQVEQELWGGEDSLHRYVERGEEPPVDDRRFRASLGEPPPDPPEEPS
ncbi:MAG: apolipoprotein N-acyltransferase [Actinomycetota bacterium]